MEESKSVVNESIARARFHMSGVLKNGRELVCDDILDLVLRLLVHSNVTEYSVRFEMERNGYNYYWVSLPEKPEEESKEVAFVKITALNLPENERKDFLKSVAEFVHHYLWG